MKALKRKVTGKSLYDTDFFEWTQQTADLVRAGRFAEVDVRALAEEIESLGKRDRTEVYSQLIVLLTHLIKWQIQPSRRGASWLRTITTQRRELPLILEHSSSLIRYAKLRLGDLWADAAHDALIETRLKRSLPRECPWTWQEILDPDFFPEP